MPAIIAPFVGEAYRNPVAAERPQLLDQPVVQFLGPFALKKRNDFGPANWKFRTVSPATIFCVHQGYALRVSGVKGGTSFAAGDSAAAIACATGSREIAPATATPVSRTCRRFGSFDIS